MSLVVHHLQPCRLTCDNDCFFTVGAAYLTTYFSYWTIDLAAEAAQAGDPGRVSRLVADAEATARIITART